MRRSTAWTAGILIGLPTASALAANALYPKRGGFDTPEFVALLFLATMAASVSAAQMYRRRLGHPTIVGALAGAFSVFAFFGAILGRMALVLDGLDPPGVVMLLLVAPVVAGAMSALGTIHLEAGVRRYRRRHGSIHAPR